MFKNCVFKVSVNTKKWAINALIRAVKTFAQTAVAMIPVAVAINEVDWVVVLATSATAFIVSVLTSLAGIPEVESEE